jgi:SpoVK/Ycf46/Vps4 family AAA+-type ATPase
MTLIIALLRPGRIETHIYLGLPTALERLDILLSSLSSFIKSEAACIQSTLKVIANDSKSSFFTSADLKNIANSSLIAATKEFEMATESTDFEELLCQHLTNVFQKFRPSMSTSELERYQGIYKDFRGNNSSSKDENPADRLKLALK